MYFKTRVSLDTGLVAHYTLDNNTLNHASYLDNGTLVNNPTSSVGISGTSSTAYSFDGADDYITIPNNSSFDYNTSDNFSFSIWVYPESFNDLNGILSTYQTSGANGYFLRINDSNGGLKYGSDSNSIIVSNALNLNQWQNIFVKTKNGSSELFVDGTLIKSGQVSWNNTDEYFSIGCDYCEDGASDSRRFFDGRIDELKVYDRTLSNSEIFDLFYSNRSLNSEELSTLSKVYDVVAPVPGDNGTLNISNLGTTSLGLSWTKASDNHTDNSSLQYRVVQSSSDRIANAETALRNGTTVLDWSTNIDNASITGLNSNTTYFFNVMVRDNVGNLGAYQSISATTCFIFVGYRHLFIVFGWVMCYILRDSWGFA